MKYSIGLSVLQWQLLKCNYYHARYLLRILSHFFIPSPNAGCTPSCFFLLHTSIFSFSIHSPSLLDSREPERQGAGGAEGNKHLQISTLPAPCSFLARTEEERTQGIKLQPWLCAQPLPTGLHHSSWARRDKSCSAVSRPPPRPPSSSPAPGPLPVLTASHPGRGLCTSTPLPF